MQHIFKRSRIKLKHQHQHQHHKKSTPILFKNVIQMHSQQQNKTKIHLTQFIGIAAEIAPKLLIFQSKLLIFCHLFECTCMYVLSIHICGTLGHDSHMHMYAGGHLCQQTSSQIKCVCVLCSLLPVQHVVHRFKWLTSIDLSKAQPTHTNTQKLLNGQTSAN